MTEKTQDRWQSVQNDIVDFSNRTFGKGRLDAKLLHLAEEVGELAETPDDLMEWADCMILLLGAAGEAGLDMDDLHRAVAEKMEINSKRKWGRPDENGVVRHVDAV
ncbi:MAG: DUF550 domain-containing protein [Micavibrio sp.]|nr:MAG: DUF550 domain-containing protein [Micavibrio sp.]